MAVASLADIRPTNAKRQLQLQTAPTQTPTADSRPGLDQDPADSGMARMDFRPADRPGSGQDAGLDCEQRQLHLSRG